MTYIFGVTLTLTFVSNGGKSLQCSVSMVSPYCEDYYMLDSLMEKNLVELSDQASTRFIHKLLSRLVAARKRAFNCENS